MPSKVEEEFEESEDIDQLGSKRHLSSFSESDLEGNSTSLPLSKKLSLPRINSLYLDITEEGTSSDSQQTTLVRPVSQNQSMTTQETLECPALKDLHEDVTDIPGILMEINSLMLTSSHYTPRDKREILAQVPMFEAIPDMIGAIDNKNNPKQRVRNAAIAAKKQLVLYYMVGKHGWQTALNTLSKTLDKNFGMPNAEPVVNPPNLRPTYQTRTNNNSYGRRSASRFRPAPRGNGGPPRR